MKCILCQGVFKTMTRYKKHLLEDHEVVSNVELLIDSIFLNQNDLAYIHESVAERTRIFEETGEMRLEEDLMRNNSASINQTNDLVSEFNTSASENVICSPVIKDEGEISQAQLCSRSTPCSEEASGPSTSKLKNIDEALYLTPQESPKKPLDLYVNKQDSSNIYVSKKRPKVDMVSLHHEGLVMMDNLNTSELSRDVADAAREFPEVEMKNLDTNMNEGLSLTEDSLVAEDSLSTVCKLCYEGFETIDQLKTHENVDHSNDTRELTLKDFTVGDLRYVCRICDLPFLSENILAYHTSAKHKAQDGDTFCKLCGVNFKAPRHFVNHKKAVHADELEAFSVDISPDDFNYECKMCKAKVYSQSSLLYHMRSKHKRSVGNSFCKLCQTTFYNDNNFAIHKKKIHANELDAFDRELMQDELKYECSLCYTKLYSKVSLVFHRRKAHGKLEKTKGEESRFCYLCKVQFPHHTYFMKHKSKEHSDELGLFVSPVSKANFKHQCIQCNVKVYSDKCLKYHLSKLHSSKEVPVNIKGVHCKLCVFSFTTNKSLTSHFKNRHSKNEDENKAFLDGFNSLESGQICKYCYKSCFNEDCLKYHVRYAHNEETRKESLFCEFCSKEFLPGKNRDSNWHNHVKNVHKKGQTKQKSDLMSNYVKLLLTFQ